VSRRRTRNGAETRRGDGCDDRCGASGSEQNGGVGGSELDELDEEEMSDQADQADQADERDERSERDEQEPGLELRPCLRDCGLEGCCEGGRRAQAAGRQPERLFPARRGAAGGPAKLGIAADNGLVSAAQPGFRGIRAVY
jgi:hypothetical protein